MAQGQARRGIVAWLCYTNLSRGEDLCAFKITVQNSGFCLSSNTDHQLRSEIRESDNLIVSQTGYLWRHARNKVGYAILFFTLSVLRTFIFLRNSQTFCSRKRQFAFCIPPRDPCLILPAPGIYRIFTFSYNTERLLKTAGQDKRVRDKKKSENHRFNPSSRLRLHETRGRNEFSLTGQSQLRFHLPHHHQMLETFPPPKK